MKWETMLLRFPLQRLGREGSGSTFARMLLDAGARTDLRDDLLGSTALGWACRWGRVHFVKLLLERGADPLEADAEPWATPLAWAQKMKHEDVVKILRKSFDKMRSPDS